MFSLTRRYPLFRKLVIAVFSVPLMFFGGAFVGSVAQERTVGAVGEMDIPREEFYYRYQSALEDYRRISGAAQDIPTPIAEALAERVRGELVSYYLMKVALEQKGLRAPDAAVAEEIRRTPDFQDESGEFSPALYRQFVTDRRGYQARVREGIEREALLRVMVALPPGQIYDKLAAFRQQQRVVEEARIPLSALPPPAPDNFPEDTINLYYQSNAADFRLREEADFEYFVLSLDDFAASVEVSEEEILAAYGEFSAERAGFERRRASHIYLTDEDAAAEVAAQAIAAPAGFAALAAEHSEDAFSAEDGGSLGIFADGDLPPELNEALFGMQPGEVHAPVETAEGGYSILKLDEVISEAVPPLEEVREEITQRARRIAAQEGFDAKVEELHQLAPLELGSLQAMVDLAGTTFATQLTVRRAAAENTYPFDDEVVLADAFDRQITQRGENSPPIPLGDDILFLRALRYQSPGIQPLDDARPQIINMLHAQRLARVMRRQIARDRHGDEDEDATAADTEAEEQDEDRPQVEVDALLEGVEWGAPVTLAIASDEDDEIALNSADGFTDPAATAGGGEDGIDDRTLDNIFAADLSYGLPSYVFIPQEEAVRVFRLSEIIDRPALAEDYLVVEELLSGLSTEISGAGYLDVLNGQYEYEFYNEPDLLQQQAGY